MTPERKPETAAQPPRPRPQLVTIDGQALWFGTDVHVVFSPADPNYRQDQASVTIVKGRNA